MAPRRRLTGPAPVAEREPWTSRFGWVIIFVVLVFFAGVVAALYGAQFSGFNLTDLPGVQETRSGARLPIGGLSSRVGALEDRAEDLDDEVKRLRAAGSTPPARVAELEAAVRRLEQGARSLPAWLEEAERVAAKVTALEARLGAIEGITQSIPVLGVRLDRAEGAADALPGLAARLARLESAAPEAGRLAARLDVLESVRAQPLRAGEPASSAQLDELLRRITALEGTPAQAAGLSSRIDGLDFRVAEIEGGSQSDTLFAALQGIEDRIDGLDSRVAEIAGGPQSDTLLAVLQGIEDRIAVLELGIGESAAAADLASIEERVGPLESAVAEAASRSDIVDVEVRVAALEEAPVDARQAAALVVAVGRVSDAVRAGRAYEPELDGLQAITAAFDDTRLASAIVALGERADTGVPTLGDLRIRFDAMATRLVRVDDLAVDAGWVDKTLDRLSSVVSVRRIGDLEGTGTEARVARAEARLGQGDLDSAVKILADVTGAASLALEDWLGDARARLAADRAVAELNERAILLLQAS